MTAKAREWKLIKAPDGQTLDVVDSTKLKKDWSIAVRTGAEMDAGKTFTIKDTFQTPKVNGIESTTLKHYAIKSKLDEQLKAKMQLYWVSGDKSNQVSLSKLLSDFPGVSVTFKYYKEDGAEALNDNDHVTSFEITVDWKNAENLIITQLNANSYTSYIEDISSLNAGDTVKAANRIDCADQWTEVTNSYTKPEPEKPKDSELRKLVSKDVNDFADNTVTIETGTPNGTVIWFKLLIKHPDADTDTVTITDTLPKGLKYVEAKNTDNTLNWQDSYRVGTTKYDRSGIAESDLWASTSKPNPGVFQLATSINGNGQQVLTFTLSGLKGRDLTNDDASIIYGVKVEDDYWKDISNDPSKEYPNEARWGKLKKSATATVTRTNFETKKEVAYNQTTQTATYTVTINEQSKQLLPYEGGYLELEDILTVPKGLSATLDQNSIVVKDGNDAVVTSDALKDCEIDPDTHTMKIKIKDGKKYKLSYTYKFVPDENLGSGASLTVQNEVKMFGRIASNNETHFQNAGGSGTASNGVTDILTLVKSEKGKNNNTLGGVTFALFAYENSSWTRLDDQTTATDGEAKGTITFRYNANNKSETGTVAVKADTLYQLVETQTAENYILDNTPHYFVMLSKNANADDVYQTFNGSDVPLQSNIKFVSAGQTTDVLKVENEARKIKVEKVWKDADGNAMAAPKDSITVTLKRKVGGAVDSTVDSTFNETLKLTQGNGWKVTYPDEGSLPETDGSGGTYYYFVTEDDVPDGNVQLC